MKTKHEPMNFFINRVIEINNSGVEHAQLYRSKLFDSENIPYKFVYVQLMTNLMEALSTWNVDKKNVISMYEYFVLGDEYLKHGITKEYPYQNDIVYDKNNIKKLQDITTKSGLHIIETIITGLSEVNKNILVSSLSTIEIYDCVSGKLKIKFNFYDRKNYNGKVIRNIHLYDQNGKNLFFWNEVQLQRYFFKQIDRVYNHENNWFLDRGQESEAALLYPHMDGSKVIKVLHSDHLVDRGDNNHPLWNNFFEYFLDHVDALDKVIVGTKMQAKDLLINFPNDADKIVAIPTGGIRDVKRKNIPAEKSLKPFKLISASRLAGEKHVDLAILSVVKLRKQGVDICLDIYGSGDQQGYLEEIIKKEKAGEYIKLKGHSKHLADIYPKYDAFITASDGESFGLTTIEALNAGLPVIAYRTRFGSMEMIEDGVNGFLQDFKKGDQNRDFNVDSLSDGINRLLKADYRKLQMATQASMLKFQDHIIAKKWKEFINALRSSK